VVIDERSAGFFALGLGMASGRPAPVLTTSGTAPAHLLPAVIEASVSRVPLLVCSADRPPELQEVGAAQTIRQSALFDDFVVWKLSVADLPVAVWRSVAARAVVSAYDGPVHLNIGFRDPLVSAPDALPPGRPDGARWHARPAVSVLVPPLALTGRGVIVAESGIDDPAAVCALGAVLGWPVLAGPRSGCRVSSGIAAADGVIRRVGQSLQPDVILRFGGQPASKVVNGWAASIPTIVVGAWVDPDRNALQVIDAPASAVCRAIVAPPAPASWTAAWAEASAVVSSRISSVLGAHDEVTEPGIARAVTGVLGPSEPLVTASSMPIRDVEWYGDPVASCPVYANRGANGIDGLVSTTLGVAAARGRAVGLLGDLAFLHDSGGLVGATRRGLDCTFVVIDNDGGGIFEFLPQAGLPRDTFERLFGTPHGVDLAALCSAHGITCVSVARAAEVGPSVRRSLDAGGVRVVLATTDRQANVAVHNELTAAITAP
jgi:2-succinyl-5-enolpyruvyl-6-hydroxy-3-cyclohexene-1-carboxylate synthase